MPFNLDFSNVEMYSMYFGLHNTDTQQYKARHKSQIKAVQATLEAKRDSSHIKWTFLSFLA